MKQEIINVRFLAHTKINTVKGIKKYRKKNGQWVENPNFKKAFNLPDAKIKKVADYEIEDNA